MSHIKSFTQFIFESENPTNLGHLIDTKIGMKDADFWIHRRGSVDRVGTPTREYDRQHIGVKVRDTGRLDPNYAFYMIQHLANSGHFAKVSTGTTKLMNITTKHINNIKLK